MRKIYVSTYCNFAHYQDTGRPINHECIVIPPKALKLEMEGKYDEAIEILKHCDKTPVKGRKMK